MAQQQRRRTAPAPQPQERVIPLALAESGRACEHDLATLHSFAERVAQIRARGAAGRSATDRKCFIPNVTLTASQAHGLGIRGDGDIFGGIVPHAFVATKAISHALVEPSAAAPHGWGAAFAQAVAGEVLAGYTAFSVADAKVAGTRLLALGPVRLKPAGACGGSGQSVARDPDELEARIGLLAPEEIEEHGLVLEQNLERVATFSVGQVELAGLTASYVGTQRLTRNNRGEEVYGGSDLRVVRGGLAALDALEIPTEQVDAVRHARHYHEAAHACFPGLVTTRSNYDVVVGDDALGRSRCGVLEQSWRVGGATGAELLALQALQEDPGLLRADASSVEIFGDGPVPPAHAWVHYRGVDPCVGALLKYTVMSEAHVHPR